MRRMRPSASTTTIASGEYSNSRSKTTWSLRADASPPAGTGLVFAPLRIVMPLLRQPHREHAALAGLALERDLTAEQVGELLREVQAEAGALVALGRGRVELGKRLEQLHLVLGADPDPGVGDVDFRQEVPVVPPLGELDADPAFFGVLDRVVGEVDDDLAERPPVGAHGDALPRLL